MLKLKIKLNKKKQINNKKIPQRFIKFSRNKIKIKLKIYLFINI